MQSDAHRHRKSLGIITGSGPEAGLDLWAKILNANKRRFGKRYQGDLDAPHVTIISDPVLGLSMELDRHEKTVWDHLKQAAQRLSEMVDLYAIACNTLNCFQEKLTDMKLDAFLVSFSDVVVDYIERHRIHRVCLLGARPVMALGPWSAYRQLPRIVDVEVLKDPDLLHRLIYDIKTFGPDHEGIALRFDNILSSVQSDAVLLACTELPLIPTIRTSKTLLDVTELVAARLVEKSFPGEMPTTGVP